MLEDRKSAAEFNTYKEMFDFYNIQLMKYSDVTSICALIIRFIRIQLHVPKRKDRQGEIHNLNGAHDFAHTLLN